MSSIFTAPFRSRARSASALHAAMLVAEGHRPELALGDPSSLQNGWHLVLKGVGAGVSFGKLPLPITRDGVLVAEIVELEQRGDDWWGRVEVRGINPQAEQREAEDELLFGFHANRVEVNANGVSVERVEPVEAYTTTAPTVIRGPRQPAEEARTWRPWPPSKPEPPKKNRKQRRIEQAQARRSR